MLVGTNNKTYYYNDKGQYYVEGQNILGNYECGYDDGIYRLGESPKKPEEKQEFANIEPTSSYGYVTRNVQTQIPELMKMAGMEGQPINQDTINKLYDILSKK